MKFFRQHHISFSVLILFLLFDLFDGFLRVSNLRRFVIQRNEESAQNSPQYQLGSQQLFATLTSRPPSVDINPPHPKRVGALRLPTLTNKEKVDLMMGKRVQRQHRIGRQGYGLVVLDVSASLDDVYDTLSNFNLYEAMIPTVKSVNVYSSNETHNAAEFCLSRFRLRMNVIHSLNQHQKSIRFLLDPSRINPILKFVDGLWMFEELDSFRTRIYFNIELEASRLVPSLIVDYAASRALPKATMWLQPHFINKGSSQSSGESFPDVTLDSASEAL